MSLAKPLSSRNLAHMKFFPNVLPTVLAFALISSSLAWAQAPKLTKFLKPNTPVKGSVVIVEPPAAIEAYLEKVKLASQKDPEWFNEYSKNAQSGVPLPYHEKLGLSKKEYEEYLAVWDKRAIKEVQAVVLKLEEEKGKWVIKASGPAWPISLLKYDPKKDQLRSTNGILVKIDDVDAPANSILRAWKGHEWRLESKNTLSVLKENFAIGAAADGKNGYLIYRLQEVSSLGRVLDDKSVVIRFPLAK